MSGRTGTAPGTDYRYGFNGKENDKETYGTGNAYDFGARITDTRLGRFLSRDPLEGEYPWQSTYCFAANNPISLIDVNGEGPDWGGPERPNSKGKSEGETTSTSYLPDCHACVSYVNVDWVWHMGSENHEKGWYKQADYYDDIIKPMAREYNKTGPMGKEYDDFVYGPNSNDFSMNVIASMAKYLKDNPTVDGIEKWLPIWGATKQAYLDYSVGKYVSGTFNLILGVSDIFLVKSIATAGFKGGFSALGKEYKWWGSWRKFYGNAGYAEFGQPLHHWLFEREGAKFGSGFSWWGKNQMFNLVPVPALKNMSYDMVHKLIEGKTVNGIKWSFGQRFYYGTPTWFKAAPISIGGRTINN